MTDDEKTPGLTARDRAELDSLAEPEVEEIIITNRVTVAMMETVTSKKDVILGMIDSAFGELLDNGGDVFDLSFAMGVGYLDADAEAGPIKVIEFAYRTTRPLGWTAPEEVAPDGDDAE